jgi:hypothetical protein
MHSSSSSSSSSSSGGGGAHRSNENHARVSVWSSFTAFARASSSSYTTVVAPAEGAEDAVAVADVAAVTVEDEVAALAIACFR